MYTLPVFAYLLEPKFISFVLVAWLSYDFRIVTCATGIFHHIHNPMMNQWRSCKKEEKFAFIVTFSTSCYHWSSLLVLSTFIFFVIWSKNLTTSYYPLAIAAHTNHLRLFHMRRKSIIKLNIFIYFFTYQAWDVSQSDQPTGACLRRGWHSGVGAFCARPTQLPATPCSSCPSSGHWQRPGTCTGLGRRVGSPRSSSTRTITFTYGKKYIDNPAVPAGHPPDNVNL